MMMMESSNNATTMMLLNNTNNSTTYPKFPLNQQQQQQMTLSSISELSIQSILAEKAQVVVASLLSRMFAMLPAKDEMFTDKLREQLELESESLADFCRTQKVVTFTVKKLLKMLDDLKIGDGIDLNGAQLMQSHQEKVVLDSIRKCLKQYRSCNEEGKAYISTGLVEQLFAIIVEFIRYQKNPRQELKLLAHSVIFEISSLNWGAAFTCMAKRLDDQRYSADMPSLELLGQLNLDIYRLVDVLNILVPHIGRYRDSVWKKSAVPLVSAITKWVNRCPGQYCDIWEGKEDFFSTSALPLFSSFDRVASKNTKRKEIVWPVQTLLMLLCPKQFALAILQLQQQQQQQMLSPNSGGSSSSSGSTSTLMMSADKNAEVQSAMVRFLSKLKDSLANKLLMDVGLRCFTTICRFSTFISSEKQAIILKWLRPSLDDIRSLLLNPIVPYMTSESRVAANIATDFALFLLQMSQNTFPLAISYKWSISPLIETPNANHGVMTIVYLRVIRDIITNTNGLEESCKILGTSPDKLSKYLRYTLLVKPSDNFPIQVSVTRAALATVMKIFKLCPEIAFVDTDETPLQSTSLAVVPRIQEVFFFLGSAVSEYGTQTTIPMLKLFNTATESLKHLYDAQYVPKWDPVDISNGFWAVTTSLLLALAPLTLRRETPTENLLATTSLLLHIVKTGNAYLGNRDQISADSNLDPMMIQKRSEAFLELETAILLMLSSGNSSLIESVSELCRCICYQIELIGPIESEDFCFCQNFEFYLSIGNDQPRSQRDRIKSKLRLLKTKNSPILVAWNKMYRTWLQVSRSFMLSSDIRDQQHEEWDSVCCFLCSLAELREKVSCVAAIGAAETPSEPTVLDEFIKECIAMLEADSKLVRETIKTNLGNYLSRRLYVVLFTHMSNSSHLSTNATNAETAKKKQGNNHFVEQAVGIVKTCIMNMQEPPDEVTYKAMKQLILSLMAFVTSSKPDSGDSSFLKKKLAGLVDVIVDRRDIFGTASDQNLELTLLRYMADWASQGKLAAGIEGACLKAISRLLDTIPVQAMEESRSNLFARYFNFLAGALTRLLNASAGQKGARNFQESQSVEAAVIHGLSRLLHMNVEVGLDMVVRYCLHDNARLRQAFLQVTQIFIDERGDQPRPVFEDIHPTFEKYGDMISLLRDDTMALVFALCDCIDLSDGDVAASILVPMLHKKRMALKFVTESAIKEVHKTAFAATLFRSNSISSRLMKVFSRIVASSYLQDVLRPVLIRILQIPEPSEYELDPSKIEDPNDASPEAMNVRVEKFTIEAKHIFNAIISSTDSCPMEIRVLCRCLRDCVREKHKGSEHMAVGGFLFLRFFCPALVSPEGCGITSSPPSDAHRRLLVLITKALQNIASGVVTFKETFMGNLEPFLVANQPRAMEFFDRICDVPLNEEVSAHDHDMDITPRDKATSSSVAAAAETTVDTTTTPLTLEMPSMQDSTPLAAATPSAMTGSSFPYTPVVDPSETNNNNNNNANNPNSNNNNPNNSKDSFDLAIPVEHLEQLHEMLFSHQDTIERVLSSSCTGTMTKFIAMMAKLGAPPEKKRKAGAINPSMMMSSWKEGIEDGGNWQSFIDFMALHNGRDTTGVDQLKVFYQHGVTTKGRPVFYFIARRLELVNMQADVLLYSILKIMSKSLREPFEIVVDCALYSPSGREFPFQRLFKLLPLVARENARRFYVVLPSPSVKEILHRVEYKYQLMRLQLRQWWSRVTPVPTPSALKEFISEGKIGLPKSTMDLEEEVQETFTQLKTDKSEEVTLKFGSQHLQVVVNGSLFGSPAIMTKVIPNTVLRVTSPKPNSIQLSFSDRSVTGARIAKSMTLKTKRAKDVCRAYENISAMLRMDISPPSRSFQASDLAIHLINVGFINMIHPHVTVRSAAYNLLCQIQSSMGYLKSLPQPHTTEIYTPPNMFHTVRQLSLQLAQSEMHLTLDFILVTFQNFGILDGASKRICVDYAIPWLENLKTISFATSEETNKLRRFLEFMTELTVLESQKSKTINELLASGSVNTPPLSQPSSLLSSSASTGGSVASTKRHSATGTLSVSSSGLISVGSAGNLLGGQPSSSSASALSSNVTSSSSSANNNAGGLAAPTVGGERLSNAYVHVERPGSVPLLSSSSHNSAISSSNTVNSTGSVASSSSSGSTGSVDSLDRAKAMFSLDGTASSFMPPSDLYQMILRRVWSVVFESELCCTLLADIVIERIQAVNEATSPALTDILVLLNYQRPELTSRAVVKKMETLTEELLMKSAPMLPTTNEGLSSNLQLAARSVSTTWQRLLVFAHLLKMIAFENPILAKNHTPLVFYLTLVLSPFGCEAMRGTLYSVLLNVVGSLRTVAGGASLRMDALMTRLTRSEFRLRFLGPGSLYDDKFTTLCMSSNVAAKASTSAEKWGDLVPKPLLEIVTDELLAVVDWVQAAAPQIAQSWRSELQQLFLQSCFSYISPLRSRCFVILGCLFECPDVTASPFLNTLVCLRLLLRESKEEQPDHVVASICFGLGRMCRSLNDRPELTLGVFWFAISMMQVGNSAAFGLAARIMLSILESPVIAQSNMQLEKALFDLRRKNANLLISLKSVETETNLMCEERAESIAVALISTLILPLADASTKIQAKKLLLTLLDMAIVNSDDGTDSRTIKGLYLTSAYPFLSVTELAERLARLKECDGICSYDNAAAVEECKHMDHCVNAVIREISKMDPRFFPSVGSILVRYIQHLRSSQENTRLYMLIEKIAESSHSQAILAGYQVLIAEKLVSDYQSEIFDAAVRTALRKALQAIVQANTSAVANRTSGATPTPTAGTITNQQSMLKTTSNCVGYQKANDRPWTALQEVLEAVVTSIGEAQHPRLQMQHSNNE